MINTPAEAKAFIESCGTEFCSRYVECVKEFLSPNSKILELGSGSGNDAAQLFSTFSQLILSDASPYLVEYLKTKFPTTSVLALKLGNTPIPKSIGAIISNKVLHLLPVQEVSNFLAYTVQNLPPHQKHIHSFWLAQNTEINNSNGQVHVRYSKEHLIELFSPFFKKVECIPFRSFILNDSCLILASNPSA